MLSERFMISDAQWELIGFCRKVSRVVSISSGRGIYFCKELQAGTLHDN